MSKQSLCRKGLHALTEDNLRKDTGQVRCKACYLNWLHQYRDKNKEHIHQLEKIRLSRPEVKTRKQERMRLWRAKNAEYGHNYSKEYDQIPEHKARRNERQRLRWKNDKRYRIEMLLRRRLRRAVKGVWSHESMTLLGCSLEQLLAHLERQWQEGMTWPNCGKWHIYHIRPLASFNLLDFEERKTAFHYTNLQPLWASDNIRKGQKQLTAIG